MNKIENPVNFREKVSIPEILIDLKRDVGFEITRQIAERICEGLGLEKYQIQWSNDALAIVNFTGNFDELMKYLTNIFSGQNVDISANDIGFAATIN